MAADGESMEPPSPCFGCCFSQASPLPPLPLLLTLQGAAGSSAHKPVQCGTSRVGFVHALRLGAGGGGGADFGKAALLVTASAGATAAAATGAAVKAPQTEGPEESIGRTGRVAGGICSDAPTRVVRFGAAPAATAAAAASVAAGGGDVPAATAFGGNGEDCVAPTLGEVCGAEPAVGFCDAKTAMRAATSTLALFELLFGLFIGLLFASVAAAFVGRCGSLCLCQVERSFRSFPASAVDDDDAETAGGARNGPWCSCG